MDIDFYKSYESDNILVNQIFTFDETILPDCLPFKYNFAEDYAKLLGHSPEELKELGVKKYYTSELIGISRETDLPYAVLCKPIANMSSIEREWFGTFITQITQLIDNDDKCDKVGISYLAKFLATYLKDIRQDNPQLSDLIQEYAKGLINSSKAEVVRYAMQLNNV